MCVATNMVGERESEMAQLSVFGKQPAWNYTVDFIDIRLFIYFEFRKLIKPVNFTYSSIMY